jgi:hypothetical protein
MGPYTQHVAFHWQIILAAVTLNVAPLPAMCRLALGAREENANA